MAVSSPFDDKKEICIVAGSLFDLQCMAEAAETLEVFGVEYDMYIVEIHKHPEAFVEFVKQVEEQDYKVLIAGASAAAHLPGMLAAYVRIPVIGVPIKAEYSIDGLDAIYSILQMPKGIPVATMGLNNATNAAIFALQILGLAHEGYLELVQAYKKKLKEEAHQSQNKLQALGYKALIQDKKTTT